MRYRWLILTFFTCLALGASPLFGQVIITSDPESGKKPATAVLPAAIPPSNIAPDAPVVTIEGLCGSDSYSIAESEANSKAGKDAKSPGPNVPPSSAALDPGCRTIITRARFEKLASVIAPNQPPQATAQLARFYSEQLLFARKARELGLDKDPHFDDILKFTYLQVLARAMNDHLQRQANMPDPEFEKYYKEHPKEFDEVELLQISIPKQKQHSSQSGSASSAKMDKSADEAAMKAEADKIYREVSAGQGDFEKLQEEAYTVAGNPDDAPDADMGVVTRAELEDSQEEIFALQPGQISRLISREQAWHIFKVVSKQTMSQADAKKMVTGLRMKAAVESLKNSVKPQFNDAYFGNAADPGQASSSGGDPN